MLEPSERELAVFSDARQLPARERGGFLDEACAGDAALRQRVEELLQAGEEAGGFLAGPAARLKQGGRPNRPTLPAAEKAGDRIGRYKLVRAIGEGGCGVVYLAEQEEPVRREVALKVIKLGMDTKSVIARFEAERQVLALMDHPNIAKVLDAGATETGRPYFVMELVRGSKVTDYCDEHHLSTRERLDLFMQACRAVQHAHQKGIIHRDLKPSNILVTVNDGVAVPKVIDFGIAKATQGKLTDHTVHTAVEQFLGTPAYMSPEQAELSALDIDTRSDIYSLGVLLYELLTGQTPFDVRKLLQAGLDEIRRTIREEEPARPSTRLSTMVGADLTAIAKHRNAEPPKLVHLVRGDLDWIVMKCLEKDRARRYETANGLALDIQRHLGNEPILACPPGGLYRLQKLVRRHRLAFTAVGVVAGLVMTGLGLATVAVMRIAHDSQAIKKASTDATENLWAAYLSEAEARRTSGRAGQRFDSLATLQKAAAIHASMEVRNSVIASLALSDLRPARQVDVNGPRQLVRFAANLEKYARVESNGTISIRAAAGDSVLATLPATGWPVSGIWFAPSRQFLLVEYVTANELSRWVWNWVQAKAVLKELPGQSGNFSPDGNYFAHSNPDGSVAICDLSTGTEAKHLNPGRGFDLLVFNNQNTLLAGVGNGRPTVDLLATDPGRAMATLTCPAPVNCLAWSPEGRLLAAGGTDNKIYVWNVETGTRQFVLDAQARPNKLAISHAGNILASSGGDASTRLWSLDSGRQIVSYPGWSDDLQFSADDRYLGAITDGGSRYSLLEVAQGREYRRLDFEDAPPTALVTGMEFSADGRMISAAAEDRLQFWDAATGKAIASLQTLGSCLTPVFNPKGTALITSERSGGVYCRTLKQTDTASGRVCRLGQPRPVYQAGDARELSLSLDGRHLAVVANHELGQSVILDLDNPSSTVTLGIHPLVDYIAISPEAHWAATGSWQNSLVKVWDARTGQLVRELHMPSRTRVWFSPDGHWLATSGLTYQLWEVGSWTPKTLEVPTHPIPQFNYLTFSPDGKIIAVLIEGRKIQLLETATGNPLATLEAPDSNAERLCFSPDGRHLAALESDQHVQLWDLRLIREQLAGMGLDWAMPPYPPEGNGAPPGPVTLQIDPSLASRAQDGK